MNNLEELHKDAVNYAEQEVFWLSLSNRVINSISFRAAFCVGYDRYMDQAVKDQN